MVKTGKPEQITRTPAVVPRRSKVSSPARLPAGYATGGLAEAVVEEARRNGLLDGDKSEHVSFRAPPALVEAAKRETGISSTSALGMLALAMLAQPDPVVSLLKTTRGRLGKDHKLDF